MIRVFREIGVVISQFLIWNEKFLIYLKNPRQAFHRVCNKSQFEINFNPLLELAIVSNKPALETDVGVYICWGWCKIKTLMKLYVLKQTI